MTDEQVMQDMGPEQPKEQMPPLRVWNVTRFNPLHNAESKAEVPITETISVMAHMISQGPDGSLVFHMVREHNGVLMSFVYRMFSFWLDCEEIVMPTGAMGRSH